MPRPAIILPLTLISAIACGDKGGADSGAVTDGGADTGDTDAPVYDDGCITVDGAGGYAWINDAIAVADDGATIQLCAAELHEETVVVDKAVNIVGPGIENFTLVAPTNTHGFEFTGAGGSLSNVNISSTRSGILVSGAQVTIDTVQVISAGNWGLKGEDATDLTISNVVFMGNGYGGVNIDGGSAEIANSEITANVGYGVKATDGAEVALVTSTITGTTQASDDDGIGAYSEAGAILRTDSNTFSDNAFVHIWGDEGDLDLAGDTLDGAIYGIVARFSDATIVGLNITDAQYYGVYGLGQGTLSIQDTVVVGDPDTTASVADDSWGARNNYAGSGIFAWVDDVSIIDTSVTGYNNSGITIKEYDAGVAWLERVSTEDTGRHGIWLSGSDTTFVDVTIWGVREVEDQGEEICYTVDRYAAVVSGENSLDWTGGGIYDSAGYGLTGNQASLVVDSVDVSGNVCGGLMNFYSALYATNNTFSNSGDNVLAASIVGYEATTTVVDSNTFSDSQETAEVVTEYDFGDYIYKNVSVYPVGLDITVYGGSEATINNNTFVDGSQGIYVYGSATITNNSWSNYLNVPVYVDYDSDVEMSDNVMEGYQNYGVYCSYSQLEMNDTEMRDGQGLSYDYEVFYDDVYQYGGTSTSSVRGLYASSCSLAVDGLLVDGTEDGGVYVYDSTGVTAELADVELVNIGDEDSYYPALSVYMYAEGTIYLDSIDIADSSEEGIEIYGYNGGAIEASGVSIENAGTYGVYMSGSDCAVDLGDISIATTASYGIFNSGLDLSLDGADISDAGNMGIYQSSGTLSLMDSSVSSGDADGVYMTSATATVTGNVIESNDGYGMVCSSVTLDSCSANSLADNTNGEHSGCDDACADPDDGGGSDTGI